DPDAPQMLDAFVRRVQWALDGHGGNLLQLTVGDKGAYLYAVFGAPLAHEDDAARACAAALDILGMEDETAARDLQIGLGSGRVRSGTSGHRHRRTYACLGDPVNLAARLMSAAPSGQAWVTAQVARAAGRRFSFEALPELKVKGKSKPVLVRRLVGQSRIGPRHDQRPGHPLVGRAVELDRLRSLAGRAFAGSGQVVALEAEAGMGKSRLTTELVKALQHDGVSVHLGAAVSVGFAASYLAWQGVWASLLEVTGDADPTPDLRRSLTTVDGGLVARLPLLGAVLGVRLADNDLTASLAPKLRKSALESLLLRYLTVRAGAQPLALVLEDCHWLDPLSADLLDLVSRAASALPVLVLLTYRPGSFSAPKLPHTTVISLPGLDAEATQQLLRARLAEQFGTDVSPPPTLVRRLAERSEGNPFFLEELVNYLHDEGTDLSDPKAASLDLPASLATLILSRIDTLGESPRRTLKVASVVGRQFGVDALTGAYPDLGARRQVSGHLRRLCAEELVVKEGAADEGYAFKHAVIQEVAYASLPFALRAVLHGRIGSWLEEARPDALDLLAHHFWHSTEEEKKSEYLGRAGDAAAARYANEAAIDYYRRLASLLPTAEQGPVLLKVASVLELCSDWADAEAAYGQALELGESTGDRGVAAWARTGRATPLRRQGRYDEAVADLEAAALAFEEIGDPAGLGQVAYVRGIIAYQRSKPAEAWSHLQVSLGLRRSTGDRRAEAAVLDNLAIAAAYQEDYDRAQELGEQALELRTALGDRWTVGLSHANLGVLCFLRKDYPRAKGHLEDALAIQLEAGDAYSIANARDNLGNVAREMGEHVAAQTHYAAALQMFQAIGDRRSLFMLYEEIAMLRVGLEPVAAFQLIGAAEALRESLGSPRLGSDEAELEDHVGEARRLFGDRAKRHQQAGRALTAEQVHSLALRLCGEGDAPEDVLTTIV
ncbi:MAG: ATP-binding protein, partial [Acidimicrobiales bacterium]